MNAEAPKNQLSPRAELWWDVALGVSARFIARNRNDFTNLLDSSEPDFKALLAKIMTRPSPENVRELQKFLVENNLNDAVLRWRFVDSEGKKQFDGILWRATLAACKEFLKTKQGVTDIIATSPIVPSP
jgi:hypothetical protein